MLKLTTYKANEIDDSLWNDLNAFTNKLNSNNKGLAKFKEEMIEFARIRENFSFSFVTGNDQIIAVIHLRGWNPKELSIGINSELKSCSNEMIKLISVLVKNYDDVSNDLVGTTTNDIGTDFFKKVGAKLTYEKDVYILNKEKIDLSQIEEVCKSDSKMKEEFNLFSYDMVEDEVPDEHFEPWVYFGHRYGEEITSNYCNDEQLKASVDVFKSSYEDKKIKKITEYILMLFTKSGEIIAETRVMINKSTTIPSFRQLGTAVSKEYRNKGIALWLKAQMIKKLYNDFPTMTEIITSTSQRNVGMNKINKKLGYEYSHSEDDYRIKIEELEKL